MKTINFIVVFLIFVSCNSINKNEGDKEIGNSKYDSINFISNQIEEIALKNPLDSLAKVIVDTSTLKGKREFIRNKFVLEISSGGGETDSLLDLNYDGFKDYLIIYYGSSGTGLKNRIMVYLYNKNQNRYILNQQLSDLVNPTFYLNQKKITGFYIGAGGGEGFRLEWITGKWVITKVFYVANEGDKTVWEIEFPLKNRKVKIHKPFYMIPPQDILETNPKYND